MNFYNKTNLDGCVSSIKTCYRLLFNDIVSSKEKKCYKL